MANDETFQIEDAGQADAVGGITRHWDSLLLVSVAWILFKIFAEPALSIVVCSIKFGWKDFANAIWMMRRDPVMIRGRAVAAFNVAAGFWRITVGTLALIIAVLIINGIVIGLQRGGVFNADDGMLAGLTALIIVLCFLLSSVSTYIAILLAWLGKLRVWLDPTVSESRKRGIWPPQPTGGNQLGRVVTTSMILLALGILIASVAVVVLFVGNQRGGQNPGPLVFVPVIAMVASAILILGGSERILKSVAANSPKDCWFEVDNDPFENQAAFEDDVEFADETEDDFDPRNPL